MEFWTMIDNSAHNPVNARLNANVNTSADISDNANSDALWRAILTKDRRYDGAFWFAVKTTGVYCRPSCSSRTPLRRNVEFCISPAEAESKGFRACKRCRPNQITLPDADWELTRGACAFIAEQIVHNPDESVPLESVGAHLGVTGDRLQRAFVRLLGISPKEFADSFRLNRFKRLVQSSATVAEALHEAGYGSSSRLYEKSNAALGMTPASYKKSGKGATIYVDVSECALGYALIAATDKGVCAVEFGADARLGEKFIAEKMSEARISERHSPQFQQWREAILHCIETMSAEAFAALLSLPLDIQISAFQAQAWSALRAIPCGETRTYSEIAESLGKPFASRAVASACASNPVALMNPCHRVIRAGGEISGYRWGVERKKTILARERAAASSTTTNKA
jgi:AraC family transcriptional regulator of adaptative response/methylated-DNA-[protein]-cysteine methyltransferase